MPTQGEMTIAERRKYLQIQRGRYLAASRKGRSQLLTEMQQVTGLHRKTLIRLMHSEMGRRLRRQQRGRTYGAAVDDALRVIAESLDYPCAERLTPNLVWVAQHLSQHGELRLTPELLEQLKRISVSTVRRILQRIVQDEPRLPRRGPEGVCDKRRCAVSVGTNRNQVTLSWIRCIMAALRPRASMSIPCNSSMWPPAGASASPC